MNHAKCPKMSTQMWYVSSSIAFVKASDVVSVDTGCVILPWTQENGNTVKSSSNYDLPIAFFLGIPFLVGSWLIDTHGVSVGKEPLRQSSMQVLPLGEYGELVLSPSSC